MIDKVHFGKRVSALRRGMGLSQGELAERLGVTAQAVSKWECAAALPDIALLLSLSHLFGVTINELLEGSDVIAKLAKRPYEMAEIACFVPKEERAGNAQWARAMVAEGWIARNWRMCREESTPARKRNIGRIVEHGGLILEIGAGPGGGFMPAVLRENPEATIIISDLSPTVVREWKRFLDRELASANIYYAAFNFCDMPFADGCIDVVSDGGGIGNAEAGERAVALKEAYRVLKPNGLLVTSTGFVTKETMASLSEEAQRVLKEKRPDVCEDLYEETVLAGFHKIDSVITGGWDTDGDDSTIADLARELGINLHFTSYVRYCRKE